MSLSATHWQPFRDEVARWSDAGRRPRFWLRDDDAVEPTPALDRLSGLARDHDVPMLLAVIPARAQPSLAACLADAPLLDGAVHGLAHLNHAEIGAKTSEFPDSREKDALSGDLAQGRASISGLLGARHAEIFVPPWNRIGARAVAALPRVGYRALSLFGAEQAAAVAPGVVLINTHVDIIDWKGTRGGRDPVWLARETALQLRLAREAGRRHVGILTHHLVHDEPAWSFLADLLAETRRSAAVDWVRARDLLDSYGATVPPVS